VPANIAGITRSPGEFVVFGDLSAERAFYAARVFALFQPLQTGFIAIEPLVDNFGFQIHSFIPFAHGSVQQFIRGVKG
jgi:hypothetical protein